VCLFTFNCTTWFMSHVIKIRAASAGDFSVVMFDLILICSLESPPSNLLKATRKPDILVLSEIRE
jgi:hypothetical protein